MADRQVHQERTNEAVTFLEVKQLAKSFGGVTAVSDCTFSVEAGTVLGLIGPNGAGKSTAVQLMAGFERADRGSVRLDGREMLGLPAYRIARAGMIKTFQDAKEWGALSVMENMLVAAPSRSRESIWRALATRRKLRRSEAEDRAEARDILGRLSLLPLCDEPAGNLSGGQRRLLEFGRVLMARPRVVLLDEPLAGVNPVLVPVIASAVRELLSSGITVVLIEHNLEFVEDMCPQAVVMALGRVIAIGPLSDLRNDREVVEAYLGAVEAHSG